MEGIDKGWWSGWSRRKILSLTEAKQYEIKDALGYELDVEYAPRKVPLDHIFLDLQNFQNRKYPRSEHSVQNIIDAILEWRFDLRIFNPLILRRHPQNEKLYVLAGHSRFEAFKRLSAQYEDHDMVKKFIEMSGRGFDRVFSLIMDDIHFEDAKFIALISNALASVETDSERAEIYRSFRQLGKDKSFIEQFWKKCEKSNWPRIRAYSYLDPDGRMISLIDAFEANHDDGIIVKRISTWIGNLRMKNPELSHFHEHELFDRLLHKSGYGTRKWQVNTFPKFLEIVTNHINDMKTKHTFSATEPLNILNLQTLSHTMKQYYKLLDELQEKKRKLYADFHDTRRKVNASVVDSWKDIDMNSLMADLAKQIDVPIDCLRKIEKTEHVLFSVKDSIDESYAKQVIKVITDHINRIEQDYYRMKNKKSQVIEASKNELRMQFT